MKRNLVHLRLFILALILFGLFSTKLYADVIARSDCIFDAVEIVFPEYFSSPYLSSESIYDDDGNEIYLRIYSNESALAISEGEAFYALYGEWFLYGTIDKADQDISGGKCKNFEQDLSTPPLGYINDETPLATSHANVKSSVIWNNSEINVCWENPSSENSRFRTIVKNAVEGTWAKESALKFIGWEQCYYDSHGIRIIWTDDGPHTKGLGTNLDGKPNGMLLNHEFNNWGDPSCKDTKDYCVRVIAVHEFGHALGFAHEQARQDTPDSCTERQESGETDGDTYIGPWDSDSVMNYCNPEWSGNSNLSETDILAVQQFYGMPSIVTQCTYSLSPTTQKFDNSRGTGTVNVTTQHGCEWNASSSVDWIKITSNNSGIGNGTITYSVYENPKTNTGLVSYGGSSLAIDGTISVAGETLTITQYTFTCSYRISPTETQTFPATGGTNKVDVITQDMCLWDVASSADWIQIISGNHGNGNGIVQYSVSINSKSGVDTSSKNTSSPSAKVSGVDTSSKNTSSPSAKVGGVDTSSKNTSSFSITSPPRTARISIIGKTSVGLVTQRMELSVTQLFGVAVKPTAPQTISAVPVGSVGSTSIQITWTDNSVNEIGYYIYRWNGTAWSKIATVGANIISYVDNGLNSNATYNYTVAAYNGYGESWYNSYVSATTMIGFEAYERYLEALVD